MDLTSSVLRMISVGLVAEMKPRNDRQCNIVPVELTSALDGEVRFNPKTETVTGKDGNGDPYEVKATTDASIVAEWLPYDDNRATPPDVVRGELVELWQNADTDQYYWRTLNLRNGLRSLESIIWLVGATPDVAGHGMDFEKCYIFQISGHDRHITLSTTKANGEPYAYKFQLNGKEGQCFLKDDIGNSFLMVSKEEIIRLLNASKTELRLQKQNINAIAAEYIQLQVGGSTFRMDPANIAMKTTNLSEQSTTHTVQAANYRVTAPLVRFNAASFDIIT